MKTNKMAGHHVARPRILRAVTLFHFLLILSFLQVSAYTFAQRITLSISNQPLSEVFRMIKSQTGYNFVYSDKIISDAKLITANLKDQSIDATLKSILSPQGITYTIQDKTVILTNKTQRNDDALDGVVRDRKTGNPIPSVVVSIRGTKTQTQTDNNGRFKLNMPANAKVLEFRYIGYKTAEVEIRAERHFSVFLEEQAVSLDETVINGIFTQRKENFTGAANTLTGAELKKVSANSVFAAIGALDPSFRIVPNNVTGGNINQLPNIQLRGENSFPNLSGQLSSIPTLPLLILDGFEVNLQRIVDLDMNLIKSVTLLKDASATALYGSRGANGVIVITTITPAAGKLQVNVTHDFRLTTPDLSVYHLLNAEQKLDFEKRVGLYTTTSNVLQSSLDMLYNERYKAYAKGVNTDWLSIPTQNGYSNRTSVYAQGGDTVIRYALQVSGDFQSGVMKGQDRTNYSGQFDLNYFKKKFEFRNSLRIFQNKSNESPYGNFADYVGMNPYWAPYDNKGNANRMVEDLNFLGFSYQTANPLYDATLHSINSTNYFGFSNNFSARYKPTQSIYVESSLSINKQSGGNDLFYSAQSTRFNNVSDLNLKGSYDLSTNNSMGYESLTTANWNAIFGKHQLFSNLGLNLSRSTSSYNTFSATGLLTDQLDDILYATQYSGRPVGDENTISRVGLLYSGNYIYDDRFLASVSYRRDGSSQYGNEKRFGTFWSVGAGWNIHNESFFQKNDFVNRLKIRGSYGSTGSLNVPSYASQFRYNVNAGSAYFGNIGATLAGMGNDFLSWQDVLKANIGLDADLLQNRLNLRFELYRENTKNAVTQITLAPSTGFNSYTENFGELLNKGFEFYARYTILQNPFSRTLWTVNVNGFTNRNSLRKISNALQSSNNLLNNGNPNQVKPNLQLVEGQSINTIFAVRSLGIDATTGSEVFLTKSGETTLDWNVADKVPVGISQPLWNGNFGTSFSHKGFEVNLIFNYQFGGQMYNQTLVERVESVNPKFNVDQRAYDLGWAKPGDVSQFRRITANPSQTKLTSRFVQDDDNLILSSASLGYTFYKKQFLERIGLRSLKLTAITNDLFRVSSIQVERGTSNPFARTYSLTLRAGF
ncbi:SusC/RagA family TonB-linked outer membrane protein [uncultured Pedobacter sp.]|uniref:SusC/RagA family TonB-linked outer membrane protein n=1 Tax=uncultured Pedobacter sp. TaxID=246139 RepID=UPI0025F1A1EB|nr:SusC/RagA family TonB-linked outer membrane protein [uncultured Pedobacter sp.]